MSKPAIYVLAFESTHAAMASNKMLSNAGCSFTMIPTPREISAGCGMSLRFGAASDDEACVTVCDLTEAQGQAALYATDNKTTYRLVEHL